MTYYNYLGQAMAVSAPEQSSIDGSPAGDETIQASAGSSSISGGGGGDLLIGSSGDNRFYIKDSNDRVQELPGGGVDTQIAYTSVILAPNVENLTVHMDFNFAVGNGLDNLIIVDGSQWINGLAGDDVLVGSETQRTSFQIKIGEGNDVIYNWNGNSQLQLLNAAGFGTAADVRAQMTQSGADTILQLSPTETLTFRGMTPAEFTDRQLLGALDTSKLGAMTFSDEFNSLQIRDPSLGGGQWNTNFGGNLKDQYSYALVQNGEQQSYVAPGFQGRGDHDIGVNPFSIENGVLTITAAPMAADDVYAAWGATHTSGMLNTLGSFAQKYGYFEMRAEVPTAAGSWPAFWMIPSPYKPNAEADIMEGLAATPNIDYRRAYGGVDGSETQYDNVLTVDPAGFHTYGMLWTPQTVTFFYDGVTVLHGATPSTWTSPMSLIVNLAVGGWGGEPDPTAFPAQLNVDYVHAYALADGSSEVLHLTPPPPVATLQDNGPASGQVKTPVTFEAGGAAVTTSHIQLSSAPPTTLPPGQTMMIWEDAGAVFGAVSDGSNLAPPTALMAGSISQFTGAGTWLTSGKVVFAYLQPGSDGGQHLWDIVFDPVRKTFVRQDLGAASATPDATFVATGHGGFAVSWHTPDGTVVARGYDEYAYGGDVPGWYGPAREVTGDLVGVTADGQVIAANGADQQLYTLADASTFTPSTVAIQSAPVTHLEGDTGVTAFTYTVVRTGDTSAAGDVSWSVSGAGTHPAVGADFQGGALPTGTVRFGAGELSKTLTVNVAGDAVSESDEGFVVTLSNPTGAGVELRNATASGVIENDDTGAGPTDPSGSGQVFSASGAGATLAGGAGDDTIYASQGNDVLTGGSGADQFVFGKEPWSPNRITDFTVGSDKLDLSALLQAAGYTGSDPVADQYVSLLDDGVGGTKLLFDRDGEGASPQWGNYVIQLDHVSSAGLTWSALSQGAGSPPPQPPGAGTLVVFAGQSNMGVYGTDASNISSLWSQSPLTQIWNQTAQAFEEMRPGVNTGYAGAPNGWGPEVAFAIDMRALHPGETLYIVKSVAGGTQLALDTGLYHADWSPMSSGELFDQTTQMINQASAAVGGLRPAAVFFGQGEEDANYQATAQAYGDNLTAFFSAVRGEWLQDPNGKIGFFAIGTSPPYSADVRAGQLSVDQADANAVSFDTGGLPLQADGLHLAAEGVNTSGDNFFQIFRGWTDSSSGPTGEVFISAGPGSTLAGGAGNDTLIGGRGDEVLTGGAGADTFSFPAEPWSPNRITDFTVGVDRLDLSSLFQKAGYTGADPVADRYVTLLDDGAGGAQVLFDRDGTGPSPQWANYILKLDNVSASGLTWSALTGAGASSPPPAQAPQLAFSSSAVSLNEGDSGSTALVFNVSRTGDLSGTASASWSVGGSGAAPAMASDFPGAILPAGTVAFSAGEASKSIVVQVAGDTTAETDEKFTVTLSNATGATLGVKTAVGTILDDDGAPAPHETVRTSAGSYTLSGSDYNLELVGSAAQSGTGSALDNTLTSNDHGSSLQGLDGADTLVAGHGADILSGGAGADVFAFRVLPWNAGHVTDFVVGSDRLDLSALFNASGYSGSDPVGDGYVSLSSDGAGGVRIAFDIDGPGGANPWPTTITTLDGVASTGLTYAQLTAGYSTPPPPPPPPPPAGDGTGGRVLTSAKYGDVLAGGSGADTLNAGQGPDMLSGAGGGDMFVFANAPWNAGHITDFTPGTDVIDLSQLMAATAYSGADPLADGWLEFRADGSGGTQVYVDLDGPTGSQWPTLVTTLDHVRPAQISPQDWLFH